jgi:TM2 domain-containing membrane protein YozV
VEHSDWLEAGEWKKEAECPECGEYSVVPEGERNIWGFKGDATATPGKQAKRDMFERAGSTPAGKKKYPVVALGLSLGVPIGLVIGLVLFYVAMFSLTYNIGNPFLTFGVPLLGSPLVLLDGSGQFYNGQVGKGFWFLGLGLGFYVLIFAVLGWGPAVIFVGVLARLTSYVWASADAYRSAKRINVLRR